MEALQSLATEFSITVGDPTVWLSIGQALLFGAACLAFGIGVARLAGLLESNAPADEALAVGLGSGLLVLASWWAAIVSGGRSIFTPVAIGFAVAVALALARWIRRPQQDDAAPVESSIARDTVPSESLKRRNGLALAFFGGGMFIVAVALLYGSTMSASPRDSIQPVEFMDEAFYSILGRDLASAGTETIYSTSGFSDLSSLPTQTWYHWGEMWLASAAVSVLGSGALEARNLIVLPILLLASAALTGTIVRRVANTSSRWAYAFGFVACLVLAPMPLLSGTYFTNSTTGMVFGITLYGLGVPAVLLGIYSLTVLYRRKATWAVATFVGSSIALIVPAHLVIAILAMVGVTSVWAIHVIGSLRSRRRIPSVSPVWRRTLTITLVGVVATVIWGFVTGHAAIGNTGSPTVSPYNAIWRDSILITVICCGAFLAIPLAWVLERRQPSLRTDLYLGTMAILAAGAVAWGLRLSEFTTFYFFYAGLAVFATPVAVIAVLIVLRRLREAQHLRVAAAVALLCVLQLDLGVVTGLRQLQLFGPHEYAPMSVDLLATIRQLPADARLAYACSPFEEVGFAGSRLLSIDAHTGRRVVPMCYEAESLSALVGAQLSLQIPNTFFRWAPQQALYPDAQADPSSAEVASFLKSHGIDYIYADDRHPNTLVDGAVPIARYGDALVLRIP